jgi:diketogulonate reductase-like aldo/keto reductase
LQPRADRGNLRPKKSITNQFALQIRGNTMEYRQLGRSGLRVSTLSLGTMTFGGAGVFSKVGTTDVEGAGRLIDQSLEAGVNLIDTANIYSAGQ